MQLIFHSSRLFSQPHADFPVMPCESTGFTLKPDGFSNGNPAIDVPPETNEESELAPGCCSV